MLSRRKFVGILSGIVAAPIVIKSGILMPLRGEVLSDKVWKPNLRYWGDYEKFVNTPYLERMDFGNATAGPWGPGNEVYDIWANRPDRLHDNFEYINNQVLAFREQEPIIYDLSRPIKSVRDCWCEAVAEINAKYGMRS